MGLRYHDKDPRSSQEFEAYCGNLRRDATVERWRSKPVHIQGLLKMAKRKTVETIAKWFDLPPQFIKSKAVGTRFRLCSIFNSRNQQQALGKHHYDDGEIKANFYDFRAWVVEKEKCARYGQTFGYKTDSAYEKPYTKGMTH